MADEPSPRARLAELRERWESDRSSRLFLQLAEEYRRHGQADQAIPILEEGLRHHPGSGAARVALGRSQLEAGNPRAAVDVLERVVGRDPTQMVAYRSLVDAYLALGDAERARDRLGLYAQLNPQDPALAEIAKRVEAIAHPSSSRPGRRPGGTESDRERPGPTTPLAIAGRAASASREAPSPRSPTGSASRPESPMPVGFAVAPRRESASAAAGGRAPSSTRSRELATGVPGLLGSVVLSPTRLPPPPRLVLLAARPLVRRAALTGPPSAAASTASSVAAGIGTASSRSAPPPTATLASLYLDQGHVAEAREILEGVLHRDPGNRDAQLGLHQATAASAPPARPALHARDLLGSLGAGDHPLLEKKAQVLRAYLGRLKSPAGHVDAS